MTISYKAPPVWMDRSGEGYTCICPECGTICRTINPTGDSTEMYCPHCHNGFRISFLRCVTEEVRE